MSKCSRCKYEYSSRLDEPCKNCKERFSTLNIGYLTSIDNFQPKEEQSVNQMNDECKCDECFYDYLSEHEEPCCDCKYRFDPGTVARLKAKDCFKSKEYKDVEVDMVNHPPHYQHGIEPIVFIESHNLNFNLGSAVKYIARAPYKGKELEDLRKAKWFIEREIKRHDNYRND